MTMVDFAKLSAKRKNRVEKTIGNLPARLTVVDGENSCMSQPDSLDSLDASFDYGYNEENPFEPEPIRDVEPICYARVKCPHCGKFYGRCSELETELTKENKMLPAATVGVPAQQQQTGGGRPANNRRKNGLDYIKVENLTTDKAKARILDVRVAEPAPEGTRNFSDIRVKIACKGATWLHGLKLNNPELAKLQKAFTLDENNWPGQEYYLYNEEDEFDGKIYMRVEPIVKESAPKKSRKKGNSDVSFTGDEH